MEPSGERPSDSLKGSRDLLNLVGSMLSDSNLGLARYYRSWIAEEGAKASKRSRDLFPLPRLVAWPAEVPRHDVDLDVCIGYANFCLGSLNCLSIGMKEYKSSESVGKKASAAQTSAQKHVCSRVVRFLQRIDDVYSDEGWPWHGSSTQTEEDTKKSQTINAAAVDLPVSAGSCDPLTMIDSVLAAKIADPNHLFPQGAPDFSVANFSKQQQAEYVKLTVRELQCGKLRLFRHVENVGGVFAVGKSENRQRKIWDGSALSLAAARPPKPRRLANPSSFLDLELDNTASIFFSKRDASTYFDALQVPTNIQAWFGQPPVTVQELLSCGCSVENIKSWCSDFGATISLDDEVFPVHTVWPMGFSWSSAVAQDNTLALCKAAGICEDAILSLDHDVPSNQQEVCLVATDDTVLVHTDYSKGVETLARLDAAFAEHNVPRNVRKDVTLAPEITALGCDLSSSPPVVDPNKAKLGQCICRTLDLLACGTASPQVFSSILGVWQWFSLLSRPMFSIFDAVYKFARRLPFTKTTKIPEPAQNELLFTVLLAPLLTAGLARPALDLLIATDASPDFGFGVCVAHCETEEAAEVCRFAERRGDYVRLTVDSSNVAAEVPRLGRMRRLKQTERDFKTIIATKARWKAHSGVLEANAYLLGLKWLARQAPKHHARVAFLVDAKVVVGAATKGRSSARALRTCLRNAAAHIFAADILPRIVYIPSESNPADRPSRGKTRRPPQYRPVRKSTGKSRGVQKLEAHLENVKRA